VLDDAAAILLASVYVRAEDGTNQEKNAGIRLVA
jgi:hypothetical protein